GVRRETLCSATRLTSDRGPLLAAGSPAAADSRKTPVPSPLIVARTLSLPPPTDQCGPPTLLATWVRYAAPSGLSLLGSSLCLRPGPAPPPASVPLLR